MTAHVCVCVCVCAQLLYKLTLPLTLQTNIIDQMLPTESEVKFVSQYQPLIDFSNTEC